MRRGQHRRDLEEQHAHQRVAVTRGKRRLARIVEIELEDFPGAWVFGVALVARSEQAEQFDHAVIVRAADPVDQDWCPWRLGHRSAGSVWVRKGVGETVGPSARRTVAAMCGAV